MARNLVGDVLLPLVRGGKLHVGKPIGPRELDGLLARWAGGSDAHARTTGALPSAEESAAMELAWRRAVRARALLPAAERPPLDEITLRLGATVHNVLGLSHPDLPAQKRERARRAIVEATAEILAPVGPPASAREAVNRHTLLARVPEIVLTEHTLSLWLGPKRYVGRTPPARLLEGFRQVQHDAVERIWIREVGVPPIGRSLWLALHRANPLAEALEPLRLDPPPAWERLLSVLRFPSLARLVAGRALELGFPAAGNAFAAALFRFAAARPSAAGGEATPGAVGFALRFLGHLFWLHHLYGGGPEEAAAGWELPALVAAAAEVDAGFDRPADVDESQALARRVAERLGALRAEVRAAAPDRWATALQLCRFAASAGAVASPNG